MKWDDLKYFKPDSKVDNWGDSAKVDQFLLLFLDEFRDALNTPLIVTSGFRKGDPAQHGLGRAVDVVAPQWEGSLFDLYLFAERFNFGGIGLYPHWFYGGKKIGGLHLDNRLLVGNYKKENMSARWLGVRPGASQLTDPAEIFKIPQKYIVLNLENLKAEGIV